ncbi:MULTISPECIES: hypothetical protein [Lysinibacillus]|jgi:hypothetical protein|uniref:hypothetical protein n=1 Tax=Lysinibacillus TaxID=400634 RepID=UPI001C8C5327|nr:MULTISPECIES: hypothetical protein [Lysinibacillus]WHP39790.1 hypothetical protein QIX46_14480 [Lysinibacillus boronitolerans]MBX8942893.1 hypothetical protein [Lysinibacillus sp. K60]MED3796795.1 hypothetical protein [Lysinibacillus capsici]MED4697915.1 hypothetical protein [Lysinibacillus capsici]UNT54815.1 hypothetical protein ICJ70_20245 [Lysinibacillus capsici]
MNDKKQAKTRNTNNPDVLDTDKESIFDKHEDMKTVDPIPVEELNEKVKDEKHKTKTKDSSATDKRYP